MISPTGKGIRSDAKGDGHYGSSRGGRIHEGSDYECEPGQPVYAPISGHIVREARPYANEEYSGLVIQGENMCVKLFYLSPYRGNIGKYVEQGDVIGKAQDISMKYGSPMVPHVHLQIEHINPDIFINML